MSTFFTSPISRRALVNRLSKTAAVTALVPAALASAACEQGQAKLKEAGAQELQFMDWENVEPLPTQVVLNNFQAKNSAIKLSIEPNPQNYEEKMRTLLAAGTPADIHRVNDDYVLGYATKGQLLDLMPYLKKDKVKREDFWEFLYDFPSHGGKYWAWSTGNQPRPLFINKTLFQNNGVQAPLFDKWDPAGWTWDDMVAAAQKLTKDTNTERPTFGVSIYHDTRYEQTFLVNFGVEQGIYSKDGKQFLMATPKGIEAIQAVTDLSCKLRVQRPFNHREGGTGVSASAMFTQGRLGMLYATMSTMLSLRRDIKDNFDWDIAPVPKKDKRVTEGSLITYCVPKEAKNPDAAWQLLSYMTSEEGGQVFADRLQYVPALKAAATKYIKAAPGEKPERVKLLVESMTQYNTIVNFTNNTERARQIYRPELNNKAYICTESVKTTLEGVKKQVEDSLVGAY
ncbi:MAG TPA: sugar ABC transporter substrate-binding protein [Chloroflexota bacterium]|nr:sugar ABC transporter substrate-binding protein [Chloroflexota bacterium]